VSLQYSISGKREPAKWRSELKHPDKVSDVAREHRPDEPVKGCESIKRITN
jgi:hypothetical protein